MRNIVGMKGPSLAFAVGWSPLLLLLLLPMVKMDPIPLNKPLDKLQTSEAVSKLIKTSSVKFDLLNYFTELQLQDGCMSPLINESNFPNSLMSHYESSMCTIIYNITKELEDKGKGLPDNFPYNSVKSLLEKSNKSEDMFSVWKNVSKISESLSLNLLMKHLNDTKKWNSVCYNFNDVLFPYCAFLHSEVLLLQTISQETNVSLNKSIAPSNVHEAETVKSTTFNNTSGNSKSIQKLTTSVTTPKYNFDLEDNENRDKGDGDIDDPIESDDSEINKQPNPPNSNDNKEPNSDDKNQNEDLNINPTGINIAQQIFSSSDKLTNRQEESHFLFYFIIMTVLSMMFYLALYNKKKIIALLIEGRRSNSHRRRPNSTSYSKVETDDANTVY